ncbi:MAG: peptidylprolyl isomerase [Planctomycetota bacterium]
MRFSRTVLLASLLGMGCSEAPTNPSDSGAAAPTSAAGAAAIETLRTSIAELAGRSEHDASAVKVQHLLVSFAGAGTRATRSKAEAETLTADLLQRIGQGEDFATLIAEHTDDSPPGIYEMTTASRRGMVQAFGDAGWRLSVGETGVAGHHPSASPYGWHIIKRLE